MNPDEWITCGISSRFREQVKNLRSWRWRLFYWSERQPFHCSQVSNLLLPSHLLSFHWPYIFMNSQKVRIPSSLSPQRQMLGTGGWVKESCEASNYRENQWIDLGLSENFEGFYLTLFPYCYIFPICFISWDVIYTQILLSQNHIQH